MSKQENTPEKIYVPDFKNLLVWEKSKNLCLEVYKIVENFPKNEEYGMKSQLKRSSSSVSANIVEGNSQLYVRKEFNFVNNALGSVGEVNNWLILARELNFIDEVTFKKLDNDCKEVKLLLIGYMKKLRNKMKS